MMLAAGGHILGQLDPRMVKMTTSLSGGVGGTYQEMCGALSASVLLIGALYGRNNVREDDGPAYQLASCYRQRFDAEFATTRCGPLREQVHGPGGLGSCAFVVEKAALILLKLLAEQEKAA